MKIITYILSILLGGFVYLLFAAYISIASGLSSILPIISFYCSILIFGFGSWFHFYQPKVGAIFLTIVSAIMFFCWPFNLLIESFTSNDYRPSFIEYGIPMILTILVIFFAWKWKENNMNRYIKLGLAIPPTILAIYVAGFFTIRYFGI